jgi:hypothetical protein
VGFPHWAIAILSPSPKNFFSVFSKHLHISLLLINYCSECLMMNVEVKQDQETCVYRSFMVRWLVRLLTITVRLIECSYLASTHVIFKTTNLCVMPVAQRWGFVFHRHLIGRLSLVPLHRLMDGASQRDRRSASGTVLPLIRHGLQYPQGGAFLPSFSLVLQFYCITAIAAFK